MESVPYVVIGAGVIGLAVASSLARSGREVCVLERERQFGMIISSRNSEVIHAGIYYPPGSLKARLCVEGKDMLYEYCKAHSVPHQRIGKLIIASSEQQGELLAIQRCAAENGVSDLTLLTREEARTQEPELDCASALFSPSTGIVDSHALMLSLLSDAERHGARVVYNTEVVSLAPTSRGVVINTAGNAPYSDKPCSKKPYALEAHCVINACGLDASKLANETTGISAEHAPRTYYAKGSYFTLAGKSPFSHLIYPIPEPGGLGVHLTLDLGGAARFGPDVEWLEAEEIRPSDYAIDPQRVSKFYPVIRRYWPDLPDGALLPGYTGIRPKLAGPGQTAADFRIEGPKTHGIKGLINLFGIESPGLTASLAIAQYVQAIVERECG